MPRETDVLQLLLAYQDIWFSHFPMLSRRAEWHIAHHLCTRGRNGSPVGELYGLAKQIFLLDDATVKERLVSINQSGLCDLDPAGPIYARTIATPTHTLLQRFDAHLHAFARPLSAAANAIGGGGSLNLTDLSSRDRALLLQPLEIYAEEWSSAVDRVFESDKLSSARRMDAKRHLISSSHWNLLHGVVRWHYESDGKRGLLADRLAAQLLQLTGQTVQTTRDHIAYLLELGLFQRMPGKALHVAMSTQAIAQIHLALGRTAERLPAVLHALTDKPTAVNGRQGFPNAGELDRTVHVRAGGTAAFALRARHFLEIVVPPGSDPPIPVHPPFTIGRTAPSDLVLNGADISRSHCQIVEDGERVAVSDMNSTNGTFLNDQRVAAPTALQAGDRLRVGSYVLVYKDQSGAPPPNRSDATQHGRHRTDA